MKNIFCKNKTYTEKDLSEIANANKMVTIDCKKDDKMISVEDWNDGELGDCLFEFDMVGNDKFRLRWSEAEN